MSMFCYYFQRSNHGFCICYNSTQMSIHFTQLFHFQFSERLMLFSRIMVNCQKEFVLGPKIWEMFSLIFFIRSLWWYRFNWLFFSFWSLVHWWNWNLNYCYGQIWCCFFIWFAPWGTLRVAFEDNCSFILNWPHCQSPHHFQSDHNEFIQLT